MINQITKNKIETLKNQYTGLAKGNESLLKKIAIAEIPEMVYNSNYSSLSPTRKMDD